MDGGETLGKVDDDEGEPLGKSDADEGKTLGKVDVKASGAAELIDGEFVSVLLLRIKSLPTSKKLTEG